MIFLKLIEIFFWVLTLPLVLFQNVIPEIPQGLDELLNSFYTMIQNGLGLVVSILTCGGDRLCLILFSFNLALFAFRFKYKWILKLVQKVIDKIP